MSGTRIYYDLRGILPFPVSPELRMAGMARTILEWARHLSGRPDVEFVAPGLTKVVAAAIARTTEYQSIAGLMKVPEQPELTERIAINLPAPFSKQSVLSKARRKMSTILQEHRYPSDTLNVFTGGKLSSRRVYMLPSVKMLPASLPPGCIPVINVYDLIPLVFKEGDFIGSPAYAKAIERVKELRGHFIVNSQHVRHSLICLFDVPPASVDVVNLGAFEPEKAKEETSPSPAVPYFLHVAGNCQRRKNVEGTIRGFVRFLKNTGAGHTLRFIGPSQSDLLPLIQRLAGDFADRIIGEGHVSDEKLDSLIRASTCGLYLSLSEGFGLPPLEFMARGVPVISSSATSVPEAVGGAGPLVDPFDEDEIAATMALVVSDPAKVKAWIAKGYARARELSWANSAKALEKVLQELLEREPSEAES